MTASSPVLCRLRPPPRLPRLRGPAPNEQQHPSGSARRAERPERQGSEQSWHCDSSSSSSSPGRGCAPPGSPPSPLHTHPLELPLRVSHSLPCLRALQLAKDEQPTVGVGGHLAYLKHLLGGTTWSGGCCSSTLNAKEEESACPPLWSPCRRQEEGRRKRAFLGGLES